MGISGAIIGDISGSQYEFDRPKDWKGCELFTDECNFTDDTVMSLAIKYAVDKGIDYQTAMRTVGKRYPLCGYGGRFHEWMDSNDPKPYGSYGNGSAMRVSYIGEYYDDLEKVKEEARNTALPTHNSHEGIKGAVVTAVCIWMARHKKSKDEIYDYVLSEYPPETYKWSISRSLSDIRDTYEWNETCQGSVPVAMRCFYESDSYVSFLRKVYSLDGDADTLAAIGGAVAEDYYGGTGLNNEKILEDYLDDYLMGIYKDNDIFDISKLPEEEIRRWSDMSIRIIKRGNETEE